jgi:hypothetical protein
MSEQWLDATDFVAEIEQLNAAHESQSLYGVPATDGRLLVRAVLLDDPGWSDWHGVMSQMPATDLLPA